MASLAITLPVGILTSFASAAAPAAAAAAAVAPSATQMPGDVVSRKTLWVLDGVVSNIIQVGGTMIAGGLFTQVSASANATMWTLLLRLDR